MIEFNQKNKYLSQIFGTLYYAALLLLIILSGLELAKRGFVSYHFNLVWLVMAVLVFGSLWAVFGACRQGRGIFSKVIFLLILFGLFFVIGAQIGVDFINQYLLGLIIVINIGLAWYLLKPEIKKE